MRQSHQIMTAFQILIEINIRFRFNGVEVVAHYLRYRGHYLTTRLNPVNSVLELIIY